MTTRYELRFASDLLDLINTTRSRITKEQNEIHDAHIAQGKSHTWKWWECQSTSHMDAAAFMHIMREIERELEPELREAAQ